MRREKRKRKKRRIKRWKGKRRVNTSQYQYRNAVQYSTEHNADVYMYTQVCSVHIVCIHYASYMFIPSPNSYISSSSSSGMSYEMQEKASSPFISEG